MLRKHKNVLFEVAEEIGFPLDKLETRIEQYEYEVVRGRIKSTVTAFVIKIKNSPFEFWIQTITADEFAIRFTRLWDKKITAWEKSFDGSGMRVPLTLFRVLNAFRNWLVNYLDEEKTPDLWEQYKNYKPFLSSSPFLQIDIEPFTPEEKGQVRQSLLEFQRLLLEHIETTSEEMEFISERLDYLAQAVDRLNRFEWKSVALSVVLGIGINLSVDTDTGRLLLRLFEQAFHTVIKLLN